MNTFKNKGYMVHFLGKGFLRENLSDSLLSSSTASESHENHQGFIKKIKEKNLIGKVTELTKRRLEALSKTYRRLAGQRGG